MYVDVYHICLFVCLYGWMHVFTYKKLFIYSFIPLKAQTHTTKLPAQFTSVCANEALGRTCTCFQVAG